MTAACNFSTDDSPPPWRKRMTKAWGNRCPPLRAAGKPRGHRPSRLRVVVHHGFRVWHASTVAQWDESLKTQFVRDGAGRVARFQPAAHANVTRQRLCQGTPGGNGRRRGKPGGSREPSGINRSGQRDSDPRSRPWQGRALPTKLCPRAVCSEKQHARVYAFPWTFFRGRHPQTRHSLFLKRRFACDRRRQRCR